MNAREIVNYFSKKIMSSDQHVWQSKKRTFEMMESQISNKLSSKRDWYQYMEQHL